MAFFSLVIPVYNVEAYLRKCVDSILTQSFRDYEIILVDDGATDNSGRLCDQIAEENPDVEIRVIHQQNKGLGGARNTGLMAATGDFVWFIDSDDTIAPNALELLKDRIDHIGADITVFNYIYTDEAGNRLSVEKGRSFEGAFSLQEKPSMLFMPNSACNKVFRRTLAADNDILFPEKLWYEDLCTTTKYYPFAKRIDYLDEDLYLYLQRGGSIMNSASVARNREIMTSMDILLRFYKETGYYTQYQQELEFLAVMHVYIFASVRVTKADPSSPLLRELHDYLFREFPDWQQNRYLGTLTKKEKTILFSLNKKAYKALSLMLKINDRLK